MPLSDEQSETLSNGQSYTVQWFERGRFELHPENQPPYNVQLGLIGSELRTTPASAPTPVPQPTPVPVSYDGTWTGENGQKREFSFIVTGNVITKLVYKLKFGGCTLETTTTGQISIRDNSFTSSSNGEVTSTIKGTFISPTTAEGTLEVHSRMSNCGGDINTGWRVTKQ